MKQGKEQSAKEDPVQRDPVAAIRAALDAACKKHQIDLVSLSGGLDSSIIAWHGILHGDNPHGVAVIADDFVSNDLGYCQMASSAMGIPLTISHVKIPEMLDGITETIKILKNFNDIEIRNNVVMYLAARWASDNGYRTIATGDGADELFAGYRFLINTPKNILAHEIDRVCRAMHFPSQKICLALGVTPISPFLDEGVRRLAKDIDVSLKVKYDYPGGRRDRGSDTNGDLTSQDSEGNDSGSNGNSSNSSDRSNDSGNVAQKQNVKVTHGCKKTLHGKWILRKAFEDMIPRSIAWRPKSAMQDGAGTTGLTGIFESLMSLDKASYTEKIRNIKHKDGVIIKSRESLHYYEVFKKEFGIPAEFEESQNGPSAGVDYSGNPTSDDTDYNNEHIQPRKCPYCRCAIDHNTRFCRMCAAFPI